MHKSSRHRAPLVAGLLRLKHWLGSARSAVRRVRQRLPAPVKRAIRRSSRWSAHSLLGVLIALAGLFVAARVWLPTLADRQAEIENYLTSTIGNPVRFDHLDTFWDGLNPGVRVQGFSVVSARTGQPVMSLREVRLSLAWWPLVTGRVRIGSLVLGEPSLTVERQADGRLRVTGLNADVEPDPARQGFTAWLLQQRQVEIENGELRWLDRAASLPQGEQMVFRKVYITLRNDGERHRLDLYAVFPPGLCADCRLLADITGNPLSESGWRGEVRLQARDLTVDALPEILHSRLPSGFSGQFTLRLDSHWRDGRPDRVEGRVTAKALSLPWPGEPEPVTVQTASANLDWTGSAEHWRLDLRPLTVGLSGPAWSAGSVRLERHAGRHTLRMEHLDVGDVATFAAGLSRDGALFDWLRSARPTGSLDRLRLEYAAPADQPADYLLHSDLRNLRFAAHERIPGMQGLTGQLRVTPEKGEFELASGASRLFLPRIFSEPLDITRLSSRIHWRQEPDSWLVYADDIAVSARDGQVRGNLELRLPKDAALSPVMKLGLDFSDGQGVHAARYYPLILPEGLRRYLEKAVVSGTVKQGSVILHGALRNFPFRDGKGRFEVRARVQDGVFEYLPGWAPLTDIDADLQFTGTGMLITAGHARIRNLEAGRVSLSIDDFMAPQGPVLQVRGRVAGALSEMLEVLADSKAGYVTAVLPEGLRAEGGGALNLALAIGLREPQSLTLNGHYATQGASLALPLRGLRLDDLRGGMQFTQSGVLDGRLQARMLGGDMLLEAAAEPDGKGSRIVARGTITPDGLAGMVGAGIAGRLTGEAPWQGQARLQPSGNDYSLTVDLSALELGLPAPLSKPRGEPLSLELRTASSSAESLVLDLQAEGRLSGKLAFYRAASGWSFSKGRVGLGERVTALPARNGLTLSARLAALNADAWWPLLYDRSEKSGNGGLAAIAQVNAEVDAVEAFGRPFGRLSLSLVRWPENWHGQMEGDSINGQMVVVPAKAGKNARTSIDLTLTSLNLPPAGATGQTIDVDPRALPVLNIRSESFGVGPRMLGALEFSAEPVRDGWRMTNLQLTHPSARLKAKGLWALDRYGHQGTSIDASLNSDNFGQILDLLGYPDEMIGGQLDLTTRLAWPDGPGAFGLAQMGGDLTMKLSKGRLPKVSAGAGRLLGVLDLRSITRYLTFDFSNVFGKGLAFDRIRGQMTLDQGNLETRDLEIKAPGADFDLSGRIGLAARDLDLSMNVTPRLMEELAITGGLIGGPAVGAAVAVLHNLVKKPFEKSTRIKYIIQGAWDNPVVTRLGGPPLESGIPQDP